MARLIIFDLDQTIVELFKFHSKATATTFHEVFNVKARLDEIDFAGKTLKNNLEELAKLKGICQEAIRKKLSASVRAYEKAFISELPKNIKRCILPGVAALIKKLDKDKGNILVLVTGDSRAITKEVLKRVHLLYFDLLVTGERAKSRIELTRKALQKARKIAKIDKVIVIGDSPRDVESGKAINALTIAVLTGFHSASQLKQAGADYVFKNLANKKIVQIIEND